MRCLATALFFAATAVAQPPGLAPWVWGEAEIRASLGSGDAVRIAWAAHVAGERQERGVVVDLIELLSRLSSSTPDGERVVLHVLDALVRMDATPSAAALLPHARGTLRVPALVLATRRPHENRYYFLARMAALADQPDMEWRVCGNQLAALRHSGFAAFCVERLEFRLEVVVRDGLAGCSCHGTLGCGRVAPSPSWSMPPTPGFELGDENGRSRTQVGLGTVAWRRLPGVPTFLGVPPCDRVQAFGDWLASYAGPVTAATCAEVSRSEVHGWRGGARLRNDVREARWRGERAHAAMLRELCRLGVLTDAEARRAGYRFDLEVFDGRGDRKRPLPDRASLMSPDERAN